MMCRASLVLCLMTSVAHGLDVASASDMPVNESRVSAASEASTSNAPVDAASTSSWADYSCYLPMNCYAGHGAVALDVEDINRGASATECAEACNGEQQCAGFVYMGTQRKCWRRSQIWLSGCERGSWGQESSEFMTCVRQASCKPQGQSCQDSGDCCDETVCQQLLGGNGKVCAPPPCKPQGQSCQNSGDCCDEKVCHQLLGGKGKVCAPPPCKPQGQSCQDSGDCCDTNVCQKLLGGQGKVCASPHTPSCVAAALRCSPTCPGCPLQECCGGTTCQALHEGDDFVCVF